MTTYYIDPSAASNGNGLSTATPYNTWVGITLMANNTYLQKRGTTYIGASVRPISQISIVTTPLTIGAYSNTDGTDDVTKPKPIIDHAGGTNGVGAVFIDTCNHVIVRDIHGTNSLGADGAGIRVRRSNNITIDSCEGSYSKYGIILAQDQAANTSTSNDITIENCVVHDNDGAGISWRWGDVSTAVFKRVKILNNFVHNNGLLDGASGALRCGGIVHYSNYTTDNASSYRNQDFWINNNVVSNNNGYGIALYLTEPATMGVSVSSNTVTGSGKSLISDSHSLWVGSCFGFTILENKVYSNLALQNFSSGSGVGIFLDFTSTSATGGQDGIVARNYVGNQYKGLSLAVAASSGIHIITNSNIKVVSNIVENCRNGITVSSGVSDNILITQNTIKDIIENGIVVNTSSTNVVVTKNIIQKASTGIFKAIVSTAGFAESYNCIYNCTFPKNTGTLSTQTADTLDVTDLTINPLLMNFIPQEPTIVGNTYSPYIPFNKGNHTVPAKLGALTSTFSRSIR